MNNWYKEEAIAKLHTTFRGHVEDLLKEGAAEPVILCAAGNTPLFKALCEALGEAEPQADKVAAFAMRGEQAAELIDLCVSPGLGERLASIPAGEPGAFKLAYFEPGRALIRHLVYEGKDAVILVTVVLDLQRRTVAVTTDGKEWEEGPADW